MFSYHCGDYNNLEKMVVPTIQQLVVELMTMQVVIMVKMVLMIHQVVIMVKIMVKMVVLVASLPSTPLRSKERE